jgi:hypothetical protein
MEESNAQSHWNAVAPGYLAGPTVIVRTVVTMPEFIQLPSAGRDFISPLYRPKFLYIRHAAPACASRNSVRIEAG